MTLRRNATAPEQSRAKTLPAPYFANQRSNISALASSMGQFSDTLNLLWRLDIGVDDDQHYVDQARSFLAEQQVRVTRMEQDVLGAAEDILPIESNCMTATELLQLCVSLQRANVELMKRLEKQMCWEFVAFQHVLSDEKLSACMVETMSLAREPITPSWQPFVGTLLEQVVEMDNETDGTITPGSFGFFSPPFSTTRAQSSTTPVTPCLENLRLSSSTTAVLRDTLAAGGENTTAFLHCTQPPSRRSFDAIEAWRSRKLSLTSLNPHQPADSSSIEPSLSNTLSTKKMQEVYSCPNGTGEENDQSSVPHMEPDESSMSSGTKNPSPVNLGRQQMPEGPDAMTIVGTNMTFDDDDTAVATVATVLGRGRERDSEAAQQLRHAKSPLSKEEWATIGEYDQDELVASTFRSRTLLDLQPQLVQEGDMIVAQEHDTIVLGCNNSYFEDDADSNADVAVVRTGRQKPNTLNANVHSFSNEGLKEQDDMGEFGEHLTSSGALIVKEIIVETSLSPGSQSSANSTMETSALDMTIVTSPSRAFDEDVTVAESLLVTPVLDRYRLEPDDTSIGVKVVPNGRGSRRALPGKTRNHLPTHAVGREAPHRNGSQKAALNSDASESTSPFVTQRSRTVYRKTPHPKNANSFPSIDENEPPNASNLLAPSSGPESMHALRAPFSRFSLPELSHRPYHRRLSSTPRRLSKSPQMQTERRHTITIDGGGSLSRTPLTAAWIAKHMPEESGLWGDIAR